MNPSTPLRTLLHHQLPRAFRATRLQARSLHAASNVQRGSGAGRRLGRFAVLSGVAVVLGVTTLILREELRMKDWMPVTHNDSQLLGGSEKDLLDKQVDPSSFRLDPSTQIPHPSLLTPLSLPSSPLVLIGLGVRTVSFLRVKVYSAGFYLEEDGLKRVREGGVAGWKSFTSNHLTAPPVKSEMTLPGATLSGEALMEVLLDQPVACAIRIVPTRNTDFGHLRDGFTRALLARQKKAIKAKSLTPDQEERISNSISEFKSFFPSAAVPKGKQLLMARTTDGDLAVEYDGKVLGRLKDKWVATQMMVAYFADDNVISSALKEDVAKGFEEKLWSNVTVKPYDNA